MLSPYSRICEKLTLKWHDTYLRLHERFVFDWERQTQTQTPVDEGLKAPNGG